MVDICYPNEINRRFYDFLQQTLRMPELNLNEVEITLSFFTSNNTGDYEICLKGITINGKPVSVKKIINVEQRLRRVIFLHLSK